MEFVILMIFVSYASASLICKGDFENYALYSDFQGEKFQYIASDFNCWYNINNQTIEVKDKKIPIVTKGADLTTDKPYVLCQDVNLVPGNVYKLQYSLFCPKMLYQMLLTVKLNQVAVSSLYIENQENFGSNSVDLTPTTVINQFCFSETHKVNFFFSAKNFVGGILDNVTLTQIVNNNVASSPNPPDPVLNQTENITNSQTQNQTQNYTQNYTQNQAQNLTENSISNDTQNTTYNTTQNQTQNETSNATQNITSNQTQNITLNETQNITNNETQNATDNNATDFSQNQTDNTTQNSTPLDIDHIPSTDYNNPDLFSLPSQFYGVSKQKVIVHFTTKIKELSWELELISDQIYEDWIKESLQRGLQVYIEGELQKDLQFKKDENGILILLLKVYRSYDISTVQIIVDNNSDLTSLIEFQVYIDKKKVNFLMLSKNQKAVIQTFEPVAQFLPEIIYKIYEVISSSLCSYFILSLFNFWNLSLMYNFLLLSNIPNFTRNIYEVMINLLYQQGSVTKWIIITFNLSEDTFDLSSYKGISQKMQYYKQGFSWFGIYGLSSIILINNLDTLFIIILLIVKMFILKLIIRCLSKKVKDLLQLPDCLFPFFLLELIAVLPFIFLSSVTAVKQSAQTNRQFRQKFLQCLLLFLCIILVPLWFVIKFQNNQEIKKKLEKLQRYRKLDHTPKRNRMIEARIIGLSFEFIHESFSLKLSLCQLMLNISVPGLIWLGNAECFLIVNTLIIVGRSIYFFKNFKFLRIIDRVFGLAMTFIWLLHHFNYCILYFLNMFRNNGVGDIQQIYKVQIYCGMIAFGTVLAGGSIQLLRVFLEFLSMIYNLIKKIKQLCNSQQQKNSKIQSNIIHEQCQNPHSVAASSFSQDSQQQKNSRIQKVVIKVKRSRFAEIAPDTEIKDTDNKNIDNSKDIGNEAPRIHRKKRMLPKKQKTLCNSISIRFSEFNGQDINHQMA